MPDRLLPFMPLDESRVELPDEEESMDELDNSEMFDGLLGESKFTMLTQTFGLGTTCCIIEVRLLDVFDEVDVTNDVDLLVAGTRETKVEPSKELFANKLFDCFIPCCCCCVC